MITGDEARVIFVVVFLRFRSTAQVTASHTKADHPAIPIPMQFLVLVIVLTNGPVSGLEFGGRRQGIGLLGPSVCTVFRWEAIQGKPSTP